MTFRTVLNEALAELQHGPLRASSRVNLAILRVLTEYGCSECAWPQRVQEIEFDEAHVLITTVAPSTDRLHGWYSMPIALVDAENTSDAITMSSEIRKRRILQSKILEIRSRAAKEVHELEQEIRMIDASISAIEQK